MSWLYTSDTYKFLGIQTLCIFSAWMIASRDQEDKAVEKARLQSKKA